MPMPTENRVNDVLPPGYILLWYEFCGVIGRGSYGVTYLCFDKNLHRKVAIKEYLPMDFACRQENDTVNPLTDGHKELFYLGTRTVSSRSAYTCEVQSPQYHQGIKHI